MIPLDQVLPPGFCQHCRTETVPMRGADIWPHRADLADERVWRCETCGARCGSHEATGEPFGTAANEELRRARTLLHGKLDPLWLTAPDHRDYLDALRAARSEKKRRSLIAELRRAARTRVYLWLAERMGIEPERCHVALFDIVDCRAAWRAIGAVGYDEIRRWDHARTGKKGRRAAAAAVPTGEREALPAA